jgi:hypothetical protein
MQLVQCGETIDPTQISNFWWGHTYQDYSFSMERALHSGLMVVNEIIA